MKKLIVTICLALSSITAFAKGNPDEPKMIVHKHVPSLAFFAQGQLPSPESRLGEKYSYQSDDGTWKYRNPLVQEEYEFKKNFQRKDLPLPTQNLISYVPTFISHLLPLAQGEKITDAPTQNLDHLWYKVLSYNAQKTNTFLLSENSDTTREKSFIEHIEAPCNFALGCAVDGGFLDIVKKQLLAGADIRYNDGGPLRIAVERENYTLVEFLLNHGANSFDHNRAAISNSLNGSNLNIIKLLIGNIPSQFEKYNKGKDFTMEQRNYIHQMNISLLAKAIQKVNITLIKQLFKEQSIAVNDEYAKGLNYLLLFKLAHNSCLNITNKKIRETNKKIRKIRRLLENHGLGTPA